MKKLLLTSITLLYLSTFVKAQDSWSNVVSGGFDYPYNTSVNALQVFKGQIYAGTGSNNGYVYRSSTGNSGSWGKVFSMPNVTSIEAMNITAQGGGYIYLSGDACCSDVPTVYRSADGVTWSPYYHSNNYNTMPLIFTFNGLGANDSMYVVLSNYSGDAIVKSAYDSNDPDNLTHAWDTVLDFSVVSGNSNIRSFVKYNSKMYLGTINTYDYKANLWSSADGKNWSQNMHVGDGFGDNFNTAITALATHSGYIYAGTANNSDGAQIWRSNDDTTWTKVAQYPLYASITSIKDIGGTLWVTASPNGTLGGQILKSTTDTSFVISNGNGFGESGITGNLASTLQFGNNIYWAGENYAMPLIAPHGGSRGGTVVGQGAEVWRLCTVAPSVISAGADQTICSGLNATFTATAGFTNYVWDRDTLSVSQMLITNIQGSHQVTAVDVNGCDASDTVNLNTIPSPGSGVTNPYPLAPAYVCKGNTINFTTSNYSNVRTTLPEMSSTDSLFIYDGGTVLDSIVVAGVNDDGIYNTLVNVTIDSLYHTEDGDLSLVLIAPNGSYMTLSSYSGYGSQNYIGTVFSPSASTYIGSGTGPFTGTYSTYDPFYYLNGPTNGTWKLQVYDGINLNQGSLKGWSLNFSQPDTNMTYAWSPATGLSSVNTANTIATGVSTTTYSLTVTNSIGCSTTDTILLHVPQVQITPPTAVVCFGSSTSLTATGGSNYYWSPATALSATTGSVVTTTASSNIMYYVTDTTAGCASIDSVNVSANPALSAVAGPDQSACYADTVHLSASGSGGSPGYTYVWNYSTGSYPTQNASVVGLTTGTATLTVTDAAGCTAENALNITVIPSTDIYGHVGYSLGNVTNGKAVIYPYRPFYTHFDTLQVQSLDAAGNYHFTSINHGDYLIKVFADTTAYPTLDPTYFGNTWAWDSATVMMHGCGSSDTANITMIEELGPGGGPGFLRGQITEGLGFGHSHAPTDPIPGVDVHLGRNPGGSAMISTTTDATGYYYFTNVALNAPGQRYTVYVDIPGLARDSSYSVVLDAAHTSYVYLDYYVDSTTIYILPNAGAGISNPDMAKENKFNVYPNPFRGNSTIEYSIPADADVKLDVYNILGTRINTLTSGKQQAGDYKYTLNNLNTGVYFVTLSVNKNVTTQRVIVIE